MATADDGSKKRKFWFVAAKPVSIDMRLEVVSRIERLVVQDCERAGGESADKKATDKAWGVSDGDSVDAIDCFAGIG